MSLHSSHGPSRRSILRGAAVAGATTALSPMVNLSSAQAASGSYAIRYDLARQQTILGLGFEIQSDSIGSGNNGLPDTVTGVPYDLTASERTRFYQQMLKGGRSDRGFRYCRLAMGLYFRGTDPSKKFMQDRYPGQAALLGDMIQQAGIEGAAVEYWSPAPGWKSNGSYINGSLASFEPAALSALGDAMIADLDYLAARGVPISMWGLQNEPGMRAPYSACTFTGEQYRQAFAAIAPKIKAKYPHAMIHANSWDGWRGPWGQAVKADADALRYVDAWTFHHEDKNSDLQFSGDFTSGALGKPVFCNEYEYMTNEISSYRTVNTAQHIMNWMVFHDAPTWFWLHALKPTTNAEAPGFSLGYWRPPHDQDFTRFPDVPVGHWKFNPMNWNAVAGFVKYMPWDSVRYMVDESTRLKDQRIMAWKTPAGKPVFALTNRSSTEPFTYTIDTQTSQAFNGRRYGLSTNDKALPPITGPELSVTVPPMSIEFWFGTS
ncbi:hypothetical protein HUT18_04940 [Streptomyces sp. NA04227]|uniref:hypothetical protein n=1 Tax=Streptomyces sp. NA04227 TaxID=2742136 RepID=UPI0015928AD1|nr:hypothetical protein [Streptomyces sp. NA04227]QKW05826.1 hypothetical protein HUT18_04940 [Streptomyces sp. NA04227]